SAGVAPGAARKPRRGETLTETFGDCRNPYELRHKDGEVVAVVRCGSRYWDTCPRCAAAYEHVQKTVMKRGVPNPSLGDHGQILMPSAAFVTLTLPGHGVMQGGGVPALPDRYEYAAAVVAEHTWPELLRVFRQRIRDSLERRGVSLAVTFRMW